MSVQEQYADATTGALGALERSAELWKQNTTRMTDQVGVVSKVPLPDLDELMDRYFEYLQRGIEVNRDFAKTWTDAVTAVSELAQRQSTALGDAVRGHAEAITDWISGEADTVQKSARAQADAVTAAKQDRARQQYQDLTKAELTDLLGKRDLPKTGTVDELVDRLVEADTTT